ncbi:metalloregulator ArsR/SmtB family transcription factor [Epidermidibacterium keratini]|uniref:Metalloregulator ArsR/SmtB family transcription factor n=1 Tax=Epidermidibacterium keratini TaxID=1891644 RepID=A0A7L4YNH1_9ACTN|nr:metalloregulator ArsR/SmtB family transcription factor [Epidermidibacterium keratini]QHC00686.1 metalloregulator ArsR/SmtB family transcription factor [Epidermidibacterium keratini]
MTTAVRSATEAERDVVVFKALAHPIRLRIVSLVAAAPEGQVSAGHIVEAFDLSQPTISHHLRLLREAGVLTTHKISTFVYYRFAPSLIETVSAVLPAAAAAAPPETTTPVRRAPQPQHAVEAKPKKSKKKSKKKKDKKK